ncbi:unnamed protein product, partial [Rotaria magnacalcarata]
MTAIVVLLFSFFFSYVQGLSTATPNYYCNAVEFTLSSSDHSASKTTLNCSLQKCNVSSNENTCRSSTTPCFDYRTLNNISYCAPGILCSILAPCNNVTYNCTSITSVCVINSCCSPQAVCLPLASLEFCTTVYALFENYPMKTIYFKNVIINSLTKMLTNFSGLR